jgi:cytochrome c553
MNSMKRNSTLRALLVAAGLIVATPLAAQDSPAIPADKFVYCTVCHGIQMSGNSVIQAPRLSGMDSWYIERQLLSFKAGWRGAHDDDTYGQEMRPMAAVLSDKEIAAVSQYVDQVTSALPAQTVDGDAERGKSLYLSCAACHGADASGNEMLASPALTGLNDWYLLTQLQNFKSGVRGSHPADTYGLQMKAAASLLTDEQAMKDVVRYISSMTK